MGGAAGDDEQVPDAVPTSASKAPTRWVKALNFSPSYMWLAVSLSIAPPGLDAVRHRSPYMQCNGVVY